MAENDVGEDNGLQSVNRLLARELSLDEMGDVGGGSCTYTSTTVAIIDSGGVPDVVIAPDCVDQST